MKQPDIIRIKHMVDAVEEISSFIQGKTIDDLYENRQLTLALIKLIEIIGEAAAKLSNDTKL